MTFHKTRDLVNFIKDEWSGYENLFIYILGFEWDRNWITVRSWGNFIRFVIAKQEKTKVSMSYEDR